MKVILKIWIIWAFEARSSETDGNDFMISFPSELMDLLFLDVEIALVLLLGWST